MPMNRQLKQLESLQLYNQLSVKNVMLLVSAHKTIITFLLKLIQFYLMILTSQNVPIRQFLAHCFEDFSCQNFIFQLILDVWNGKI